MRWPGLFVVGVAFLHPARVGAQAVPLADVVGTWVKIDAESTTVTLILRPDSTFRFIGYEDPREYHARFQRWHSLHGDTIAFGDGTCLAGGNDCTWRLPYRDEPYRLARAGDRLTLTPATKRHQPFEGTYTRAAPPTAAQTAQLAAALVGTWVGTWNHDPRYPATLIVRPNGTYARAPGERFRPWTYLLGDVLSFEGEQGYQITLEGDQLTLWNVNPARRKTLSYSDIYVYHRAAPR